MIKSMTAFAREQTQNSFGTVSWEIRTVNHRYLEVSFRLPDAFREYEPKFRELCSKHLNRGKIECSLRFHPGVDFSNDFEINASLLKSLSEAAETVRSIFDEDTPTDLVGILRWPGVLNSIEGDMSVVFKEAVSVFEKTLKSLTDMRQREGDHTKKFLEQRLKDIAKEVKEVRKHLPEIVKSQRERLLTKLEEMNAEYNKDRFEQELLYLIQRTDVAEELDRLDIHIEEVQKILNQKDAAGRRLDFLMQELNREANTLGSKSVSPITTRASVELKVLIEQMREQVQNIE
jgi:uncharacterized protein (TIGR00255 family)